VLLWQKNLCESLNLKGRILISESMASTEQLAESMANVRKYVRETRRYEGFKKTVFNEYM
jgi:UPF0176 protein